MNIKIKVVGYNGFSKEIDLTDKQIEFRNMVDMFGQDQLQLCTKDDTALLLGIYNQLAECVTTSDRMLTVKSAVLEVDNEEVLFFNEPVMLYEVSIRKGKPRAMIEFFHLREHIIGKKKRRAHQ